MRALVIVLTLWLGARFVAAAPRYEHTASTSTDPTVVAAEKAWAVAAAARSSAQADLWEDAAAAFLAIAEAGTLPHAELVLAARTAVLAVKNSLAVDPRVRDARRDKVTQSFDRAPVPRALTVRDERLVRLFEVAARFETAADERASLAFMRARIWQRFDHLDEANAIYLDIVAHHPTLEVAEYSASALLDNYNRAQKFDALAALARQLRADKRFIAHHAELARTVDNIYIQSLALSARTASERGRATGDRRYFEECATAYLAMLDGTAPQAGGEQILANALRCFEQASAIDRALAALARIVDEYPSAAIASSAQQHAIALFAVVGRFADAATTAERWLAAHPGNHHVPAVLADAVRWRMATSGVAAAVRVLEAHAPRAPRGALAATQVALVGVSLAASVLSDGLGLADGLGLSDPDGLSGVADTDDLADAIDERGDPASRADDAERRALARRLLARRPAVTRTIAVDSGSRLALARTYADAACSVARVDGLCPRALDATLRAAARDEIARIRNASDAVLLFRADRALEAILARHAPVANLDADYAQLADSSDPVVRVAALARLATLAAHVGDAVRAAVHLRACIAEARATGSAAWHARCARSLARVSSDRGDRAEHVGDARAPVVVTIEMPPGTVRESLAPTAPDPVELGLE